ncbi:two-component system nitrate/nitrite response regulator NarL [Chitinivorax tropicus]|uniref:Two-component system nitrate/nitrite response regulator NarL n=1 Tax=Chitinivorax tropicus TaxID=714531 RepID=A0A840MZ50_9PROT|nr:response regulator transcription factor [Chitinivorax tropicus]MBB5020431.1 two-component system nitrate/nitrite response regulator NarL [Chitinivorax tropicus]
MSKPIRILLVDDHTLFRSGIKALLSRQPEFDIVGEASDGVEGVKRAVTLKPDVVLLDLNMPGLSGIEAVQLILQDAPETAVVMLTVSEDADDLAQALQAGARGYLLKNIDADYLKQAIQRAAAGEAVMAESMTGKLMQRFRSLSSQPAPPPEKEKLTPREREILLFLARGDSNKEIARELNVAESTVKIHVQNILKKLNLSSRVQAAVYAVEHGMGTRGGEH